MSALAWCDDYLVPAVLCPHCGGSETGAFLDIPDHLYHADQRSLSSSGARLLLPPSCPALFRWRQTQPPESNPYFDVGHAFHSETLGVGAPVDVLDPAVHGLKSDGTVADNPRATAAWKRAEAASRARGATPVHVDDWRVVKGMVAAVRAHPLAAALLDGPGAAEVSLYCHDDDTGVLLRARPDWLPAPTLRQRTIIVDLKSAATADPQAFSASAARFGYACQAPWYIDAVRALGIDDDPAFVFVVVGKEPPHPVSVIELDADAIDYGRRRNRQAIDTYARCVETGTWPGYGDGVHLIGLPRWTYYQEDAYA